MWRKTKDILPPFGELVMVYCPINGRFFASYEYIGSFMGEEYGNWKHGEELGILPPTHWMVIPDVPEI